MKKNFVLILGALLIFCIVGCTGGSRLVGKWIPYASKGFGYYPDFLNNGGIEFSKDGIGCGPEGDFTWKIDKGTGRLTWYINGSFDSCWDFKVSGSKLTLYIWDDHSRSLTYKKQ